MFVSTMYCFPNKVSTSLNFLNEISMLSKRNFIAKPGKTWNFVKENLKEVETLKSKLLKVEIFVPNLGKFRLLSFDFETKKISDFWQEFWPNFNFLTEIPRQILRRSYYYQNFEKS